jgi:hypothetical protein
MKRQDKQTMIPSLLLLLDPGSETRDPVSRIQDPGSRMEKIRTRDRHPGSATLPFRCEKRIFSLFFRYAVIIMEYVGSRNLHRLLIETPDKFLGTYPLLLLLSKVKDFLTILSLSMDLVFIARAVCRKVLQHCP